MLRLFWKFCCYIMPTARNKNGTGCWPDYFPSACRKQVTKSFPSWKQAHVRMGASKTNQTRWEWYHNTFISLMTQYCQISATSAEFMIKQLWLTSKYRRWNVKWLVRVPVQGLKSQGPPWHHACSLSPVEPSASSPPARGTFPPHVSAMEGVKRWLHSQTIPFTEQTKPSYNFGTQKATLLLGHIAIKLC